MTRSHNLFFAYSTSFFQVEKCYIPIEERTEHRYWRILEQNMPNLIGLWTFSLHLVTHMHKTNPVTCNLLQNYTIH